MFTQCAKCETIFRLSADVLRAARGEVRCGRCGEVFSALGRLAENPADFVRGESPLDLESRADAILEFPPSLNLDDQPTEAAGPADDTLADDKPADHTPAERAAEDCAPPDVEIARLEIIEPFDLAEAGGAAAGSDIGTAANESKGPSEEPRQTNDEADDVASSMEFTLPPGELDRIFVESRPGSLLRIAAEPPYFMDPQGPRAPAETLQELPSTVAIVARPGTTPSAQPAAIAGDSRVDDSRAGESRKRIAGLEVSEHARDVMRSEYARPPPSLLEFARRQRIPMPVWATGAVLLIVLLAMQMLTANRAWLASHAPPGSSRRAVLSAIGLSLPASVDLSAYQLRQWGVSSDPLTHGALKVRASISNTAAQLRPFPLLRVTFINRFGAPMGGRDFSAAEYAGKTVGPMMTPGEQLDAAVNIEDPGKDAEGFEIDVCLRSAAGGRIDCAGDVAVKK